LFLAPFLLDPSYPDVFCSLHQYLFLFFVYITQSVSRLFLTPFLDSPNEPHQIWDIVFMEYESVPFFPDSSAGRTGFRLMLQRRSAFFFLSFFASPFVLTVPPFFGPSSSCFFLSSNSYTPPNSFSHFLFYFLLSLC